MFAKNDVKDRVDSVRDSARGSACEVRASLKDAADQSCSYIKDNPWAGVGAGAVVGLVIGFLLGKK
ncbi:glycine zipper domain-containing protein [Serratia odorifera]|jgi:ElaB/YqjD/DUF883 family membrane-anchored ribosome-binding protein|uniref:DUF883 domain-containing protein n=2 Tax=Serratia odorifera TaxID=618 RepID=D4E4K7_SEROD|nr:DUF883 family protein [Serratia odorifera]EFE95416.1 hypothetical protein HMPREF0758_3107 [Serratia odorifera DSM 4582]MBJ2064587.1 DUF883 family protein [Serratia odorifera]PNK89986.1 DUF883 domain-containing protein [Serratia odorifera]RII71139.1 DUF883 family protein [Serratia odorifera]VDZ61391.1 Bacterial protein of uncharacterised function (DUF883) [Serratia odorifera]